MSSNHDESPKSLFDLLSEELIIEILTRIPSKSLCRFQSVSKRFNSIISDPKFRPMYVSRVSSFWVILDRIPEVVPDSDRATQFQLVDRPKISTYAINPWKLAADPLSFSPDRTDCDAKILQTSNGLILFTLKVHPNPNKNQRINRYAMSLVVIEDSLYVVNPITREWVGLPNPQTCSIGNRSQVGFTTRVDPESGVVNKFMAVEYRPNIGSNHGILLCFRSDMSQWVEKTANYMLGERDWRGNGSFEYNGKLFWVDLCAGLITWDVKNDDYFKSVESYEMAVCRFIPLPKGRMKPVNTPGLKDERWVGSGGGFIQFIEVFKEKQSVLKCWRLKNYEVGGEWSLMYKVSRENVERFVISETGGCIKMPKPCFVHPFEPDVAYFKTEDVIFSFNLCNQKGGTVEALTPHEDLFPFILPKWPSPISEQLKRLCASNAKDEGNECFKKQEFIKAIECYSMSIDLSPNAASFANRAMAYLKVNKYEEAEDDCTESLKLDANYFKVYWRRAEARKELGNLTGALEDVDYALKLEPENGNVKKLHAELIEKVSSEGAESGTEGAARGMDVKAEDN